VTGIPAAAGAADGVGDAGDDVVGHAGALERERLFSTASEDERVAALQPHHAPPAARRPNHQRLYRRLRQRMAAGALADEEPLRCARVTEDALVDERVVEHEIGSTQPYDGESRQQSGIARSGADERGHVRSRPGVLRSV
jgi:hypothetical protein